jgi:hypothetical protein
VQALERPILIGDDDTEMGGRPSRRLFEQRSGQHAPAFMSFTRLCTSE